MAFPSVMTFGGFNTIGIFFSNPKQFGNQNRSLNSRRSTIFLPPVRMWCPRPVLFRYSLTQSSFFGGFVLVSRAGTIPSDLGSLVSLTVLVLSKNMLTGKFCDHFIVTWEVWAVLIAHSLPQVSVASTLV